MKLIITVDSQDEVDAILAVLTNAEEEGELDFVFNCQLEDE